MFCSSFAFRCFCVLSQNFLLFPPKKICALLKNFSLTHLLHSFTKRLLSPEKHCVHLQNFCKKFCIRLQNVCHGNNEVENYICFPWESLCLQYFCESSQKHWNVIFPAIYFIFFPHHHVPWDFLYMTDFYVYFKYWFSIFMLDEIQICHACSNLPSVFIKERFYQYKDPELKLFQRRKCGIKPTLLRSATDICSLFIFHILLYLLSVLLCLFPQCFCIFFWIRMRNLIYHDCRLVENHEGKCFEKVAYVRVKL